MNSDNHEDSGLLIGELAQRTGASTRSLRYYQQRGLLTASRDRNGYRRYHTEAVDLVTNLRRLLGAGLSVTDIQQFGNCLTSPALEQNPCAPALAVYEQRLRTLDDQIATLTHVRNNLAAQTEYLRTRIQSE